MIIDSSVWIDFARGRDTDAVAALEQALRNRTAMTTDVVRLEVLAGYTRADQLAAALDACEDLMQLPRVDVEDAAGIYRTCRRAGETVRALNDCLVAAIAIRHATAVLHSDRDYDVIARYTDLQAVTA